MLNLKRKATLAVIGTVAALSATVFVAPFTANRSQAAVAVFDEENIAQAIKTAINTASILTETQKQLALEILNTKSFDRGMLERYISNTYGVMANAKSSTQRKVDDVLSIMHLDNSMNDFWKYTIHNIDDIASGDITAVDLYNQFGKHRKAEEVMTKTAVNTAKDAVTEGEQIQETVNESLENSANAEGQVEATQANTQATAAGVAAVEVGNTLISTVVAQQAQKDAIENAERVAGVKYELEKRSAVTESADSIINNVRWIKWK